MYTTYMQCTQHVMIYTYIYNLITFSSSASVAEETAACFSCLEIWRCLAILAAFQSPTKQLQAEGNRGVGTSAIHASKLCLQAWGGGSVCQEYAEGLPPVQIDCRVADATGAFTVNGTCYAAAKTSLCTGNGEVELKFGSPEYVGLGALVFLLLVLLETFGSPFMRNCEVRCMPVPLGVIWSWMCLVK